MLNVVARFARNIFKPAKCIRVNYSINNFCRPVAQGESSGGDTSKVEIPTRQIPYCTQFAEGLNTSIPTIGTPRPLKDPPEDYHPTTFTHQAFVPPPAVGLKAFRRLCDEEELGPGAGKSEEYKNPEYYSYHRYSFAEIMAKTMNLRDNGPMKLQADDQIKEDEQSKVRDVKCEDSKGRTKYRPQINPDLPTTYCVPPLSPLQRNVKTYVVPIRRTE